MLHAVFLRPKTVLQYFACIFSYDKFSLHDNHKPPTETKENNFLGTVIDPKVCFKRGIQELSKMGLKVMIYKCIFVMNTQTCRLITEPFIFCVT
jgi:hypothetical protein